MSAGHPKTGTPGTYNDGDEHNYSRKAIRDEQRHHLQKAEGYKPSKSSHAKTSCSERRQTLTNCEPESQNHAMDAMLDEDVRPAPDYVARTGIR